MPPVGASAQGIRSAGFSPDQIGSLEHWYDATKLSGFSDGNSVPTWDDEQGTNDLTQGTGSAQPTYKTDSIGGHPVIRFDGTDDFLNVAWSALSQPNTVFAVFQFQSIDTSSTNESLYGSNTTANRHTFQQPASNNWRIHAGVSVDGGTPDTNANILTALYDTTSSFARINGSQVLSGDAGSDTFDGLTVGGVDGDGSNPGQVDVGELLIYSADVSSDQSAIETHLSEKWGIAI